MNAGRELDRLIGERVMGLHLAEDKGTYRIVGPDCRPYGHPWIKPENAWVDCPSYSTNIGWAWQVVEKITARTEQMDYNFVLAHTGSVWTAEVWDGFLDKLLRSATGATAPEAICLLALAEFGVEVSA